MTAKEERAYEQGQRSIWRTLLGQCLRELGYADRQENGWVAEREAAIAQLRMACEDHGDNDWEPDLRLADIIEKHLVKHLE